MKIVSKSCSKRFKLISSGEEHYEAQDYGVSTRNVSMYPAIDLQDYLFLEDRKLSDVMLENW